MASRTQHSGRYRTWLAAPLLLASGCTMSVNAPHARVDRATIAAPSSTTTVQYGAVVIFTPLVVLEAKKK